MVSIIVCSTHNDIPDVLKDNIEESIGVPYELIVVDNSLNEYSIFEAYNIGVERSSYPYLCFIHEDVMFRSRLWGKLLCEAFRQNEVIGLIGVIGTTILPYLPLGWWSSDIICGNVIQSDKSKKIKHNHEYLKTESTPILSSAVVVDGLFLSMPRTIFDIVKFDTTNFNGFHCYDLDICMQVITNGYKVFVAENIVIEHFSMGNADERFIEALRKFNKKWEKMLPCGCDRVTKAEITRCNDSWLETLLNNRRYVSYNIRILSSRSMKSTF